MKQDYWLLAGRAQVFPFSEYRIAAHEPQVHGKGKTGALRPYVSLGSGSIADLLESVQTYLALDYDVTRLFPSRNRQWEKFKHYANMFKFPAPAIRFTPDAVWYGLYF